MVKRGFILFFTMIMLAMGTAIITQVFYTGNLFNSYVAITLDKERARELALGGVSVAMSQLMLLDKKLSPPKDKEKDEKEKKNSDGQKRSDNQKKLLEVMLQVQNRWQTFILNHETDGIDAELKVCISCENGKIDCNKLYNYEVGKFLSPQGKPTDPLFKVLGEKLAPLLKNKNITDSVKTFIDTQKRPIFTVTEFLKNKKIAEAFDNRIFYIPQQSVHSGKSDDVDSKKLPLNAYLADVFTVQGEGTMCMWSLSSSLQKAFGLYSDRKMTQERAREIVKKVIPSQIKNIEKLSQALETIYGGKNNALAKEFLSFLDPKFEPRLFSVLCYAKVGRVGQTLLAVLEKNPIKDGEIIKMIKINWI
ncbi:MAG: hypothetical protein ACJAZS_000331 [Alteromonas naphthalenivorans]|jgi:hypothetical protein